MDIIFAIKCVHLLAAAVMLGTWLCLAIFLVLAHRSGNTSVVALTAQFVVNVELTVMASAFALELISGFPLGTPPRRENFPQRNVLIAALSLGTLVVEAARRSGSLITARLAAALGREVFAIPGSIQSPLSRGCHELIRQGAKLTETAHDILSELNFSTFFPTASGAGSGPPGAAAHELGMDKEHKILLDALGFDPADLDILVVRTGFKPEAVSSMMLILELEGHVQAAPGGRYSRVVRSRR